MSKKKKTPICVCVETYITKYSLIIAFSKLSYSAPDKDYTISFILT